MIRSILVAMDGSSESDAAVSFAIAWARRSGAELVGLGVIDEPSITKAEPISIGATAFKHRRDEVRLADADRRVRSFLASFDARCAQAGVRCSLLEDVGAPYERIVREAERCDVVALGRETNFHFETQDRGDRTLGQILRLSPRPVVVVPRGALDGSGVLIAYGGGREIARTLQTLTLLRLAGDEMVDIIAVHSDRAEADRRLQYPDEYLTAHQIPHRVHAVVSDAHPAEIILAEVGRRRPRLLVMGAHGHHPIRDLFVTSVTRAVLKESPVPVFIGS